MGLALTTALVTATLATTPALAVSASRIVAVVNAERQANGLPRVRESPPLSAGCAQYDNYRRLNGSLEDAFTLHGETPGRPGYTPAGAEAATHSLLNAGDRVADGFAAGDVFDDAPNHLVALMDPAVAVVGADQTDFPFALFGTVHLVCIDVRSAASRANPRHLRVYVYRGPRGRVPRRHLAYREGPRGLGSVVALYLDAPRGARVALKSLTLIGPEGRTRPPAALTVSGGLGRARAAISKEVARSPTPTAVFRSQWSLEETPAEAEIREDHERAAAERLEAESREREREERVHRERHEEDERGEKSFSRESEEREEQEAHERRDMELMRFDVELRLPPFFSPLPVSGSRSLFE